MNDLLFPVFTASASNSLVQGRVGVFKAGGLASPSDQWVWPKAGRRKGFLRIFIKTPQALRMVSVKRLCGMGRCVRARRVKPMTNEVSERFQALEGGASVSLKLKLSIARPGL